MTPSQGADETALESALQPLQDNQTDGVATCEIVGDNDLIANL